MTPNDGTLSEGTNDTDGPAKVDFGGSVALAYDVSDGTDITVHGPTISITVNSCLILLR